MSQQEMQEGLERLRAVAADFRVGQRNHDRMAFPLLDGHKVRAWVSEEMLSDLPSTPELEGALQEGVEATRRELRAGSDRIVLITTTGLKYES